MEIRKRPVEVEAERVEDRTEIQTREGTVVAEPGDFIITGVEDERYPIDPEILFETYEPVDDEAVDTFEQLADELDRSFDHDEYVDESTEDEVTRARHLIREYCDDHGLDDVEIVDYVEPRMNHTVVKASTYRDGQKFGFEIPVDHDGNELLERQVSIMVDELAEAIMRHEAEIDTDTADD